MNARQLLLLALLSTACSGTDAAPETVAETRLAVNACDETVPAERTVDGLPAYAQCSAVSSSNIWSNNGVDTSASSMGSDWVQTQQGGGYQCTEWAYRYMHFRWGVDYRHGDARQWCDGNLPATLVKASTPAHGDLIVFDAGVCGADATTGHIAVIDTVSTDAAKVTFVEQNTAGRRTANQSCGLCFLHAVANDGSSSGAAGMGSSGSTGSGAAGASGFGGRANAAGGAPGLAGRAGVGGAAGRVGAAEGGASGATGGSALGAGGVAGSLGMSGSAGSADAGRAGSLAAGGSGAPPIAGGAGGSAPAAAGAPTTAGSGPLGAAGQPPIGPSTNDAWTQPSDAGCSIVGRSRFPSSGASLSLLVLLVAGAMARRRRAGEP